MVRMAEENRDWGYAGQFRIVPFRIGNGPLATFLFDAKTGAISRLPSNAVREEFLRFRYLRHHHSRFSGAQFPRLSDIVAGGRRR